MDKYKADGYRKYIWKYFKLHANQRIALFRFYVVFFSLYAYAIAHLIIAHNPPKKIELVTILILSIFFILVTFVFCKLDKRNKDLIHYAEDFFVKYEGRFNNDEDPYQLDSQKATQIFTREKHDTQNGNSFWRHTRCFRCIFWLGLILGFVFLMYAVAALFSLIPHSFFS